MASILGEGGEREGDESSLVGEGESAAAVETVEPERTPPALSQAATTTIRRRATETAAVVERSDRRVRSLCTSLMGSARRWPTGASSTSRAEAPTT
jgi:hypothetical protein